MSYFELLIGVFTTVVLFLYGLQSFSAQLQALGRNTLHSALQSLTRNRLSGFALGAAFTALVQSSSAVTALTVALVDAGAIGFGNSLAVLVGTNVGTTATAWLVSFKLTGIGPIFILAGAGLGLFPGRAKLFGKSLFYFGFIFFALDLISESLAPVKADPNLMDALQLASSPLVGALIGAGLAALVQSSSVVTGLAILLVQQGAITIEGAIAIVVGANAGTTITGLLASIPLGSAAKRTAVANLIFNLGGVILFVPLVPQLTQVVLTWTDEGGFAVAAAHLVFNLAVALILLPLLGPIGRRLQPTTSSPSGPMDDH